MSRRKKTRDGYEDPQNVSAILETDAKNPRYFTQRRQTASDRLPNSECVQTEKLSVKFADISNSGSSDGVEKQFIQKLPKEKRKKKDWNDALGEQQLQKKKRKKNRNDVPEEAPLEDESEMQVDRNAGDDLNEHEVRQYERNAPGVPVPSSKFELVRLLQDKKIPKPRKIEIVCSFLKEWDEMTRSTAELSNFRAQITKADMGTPQFVSFISEWVQHGILWSFKTKDNNEFTGKSDLPPKWDSRYWDVLGWCLSCKALPHSASVSPGLMRCLNDFVAYRNDEGRQGTPWMTEDTIKSIGALLSANQRSFRPELDHWVALAVTALKQLTFNDVYFGMAVENTCLLQHKFFVSVLEGFSQFISSYPNRKKTFLALVDSLLDPLLSAHAYLSLPKDNAVLTSGDLVKAVEESFTDEVKEWQKRLQKVTDEILSRGLFHPVHIGSFHRVCKFLSSEVKPIPEGGNSEPRPGNDQGFKKVQDERDMTSYQKRLFRKLDELRQEASVGLTEIGWVFEAYSRNLTVSEAADAFEVFGLNTKGKLQVPASKGKAEHASNRGEEGTRKVGGTPSGVQQVLDQKDQSREARFAVFAEVTGPILTDLQRCWLPTEALPEESRRKKKVKHHKQGSNEQKTAHRGSFHLGKAELLLGALNGLLKGAVKERTYVPTEDSTRQTHFKFLLNCFGVVTEFGKLLPSLLNDPDVVVSENSQCKPWKQDSRFNLDMPVSVELIGRLLREIVVATGYVLELEYRVADNSLDDVWAILLHGAVFHALFNGKEKGEVTNREAVGVACQLITTYSDLRQVDRALFTLCRILRMFLNRPLFTASQGKPWKLLCNQESSGFLVSAAPFLSVVATAMRSLPEGQVADFIRLLKVDTLESMSALGEVTPSRQRGTEPKADHSRTQVWCQIGLIQLYSCILENVNVTPTNSSLCFKSVSSFMEELVQPSMAEVIDSCLMHGEDITGSLDEGEKAEGGEKGVERLIITWTLIFKLRLFLSSRDLHRHCLHLIPPKALKKATAANGGFFIDYHKSDIHSIISRLSAGIFFSAVGRDSVKVSDFLAGLRVKMNKEELSASPELDFTLDCITLESLVELARHVQAISFLVTKYSDLCSEADGEKVRGSLLGEDSRALPYVAGEEVDAEVLKKLKKLLKSLKKESRSLARSLLHGLPSLSAKPQLAILQPDAGSEARVKSSSELAACFPSATGDAESDAKPPIFDDTADVRLTWDPLALRRWHLYCQTFDVWAKFAAETTLKKFLTCIFGISFIPVKSNCATCREDDETPVPEVPSMQQVAKDVLTNGTFFEDKSIRGVFASSFLETFSILVCSAYGSWPFEWSTCGTLLEKEALIKVASEFSEFVEEQVGGRGQQDLDGDSHARKFRSLVRKRKKWKMEACNPDKKTLPSCIALLDRLSALPPGYIIPGEAARCAFAIQCFERMLVQTVFYERLNALETKETVSEIPDADCANVLLVLECLCSCRKALLTLLPSAEHETPSGCSLLTVLSGSLALIKWPSQSLHAIATCLVDIVGHSSLSDEEKLNKLYAGQNLLHIALERTAALLTYIYTGSLQLGVGANSSKPRLSVSSVADKVVTVLTTDGNDASLSSVKDLVRSQGVKIDELLDKPAEAEETSSSRRPQVAECPSLGDIKSWFSGLVSATSVSSYLWSLVSSLEQSVKKGLKVDDQLSWLIGGPSSELNALEHIVIKTLIKALELDGSHAVFYVGEKEIDPTFQWTALEANEGKDSGVRSQASQGNDLNQKNGDPEESDEDDFERTADFVHPATEDKKNESEEEEEEEDDEDDDEAEPQDAEVLLKEEDQEKVMDTSSLIAEDSSNNSVTQIAALEVLFETRSMGKCEIIGELYLAAAAVLRLEALKLSQQEGSKSSVHLSPGGGVLLGAGYWILFQAAKQIRSGSYTKLAWLIGVVKYIESVGSLLSHMISPLRSVAFSKLFDVHLYILGSLPATKSEHRYQRSPQPLNDFDQLEPSPGVEEPSGSRDEAEGIAEYTLRETVISSLRSQLKTASRYHSILALQAMSRALVGASEVPRLATGLEIGGSENGKVGRGVTAGVESLAVALEAVSGAKRLRLLANHFREFAGAIFSLIERTAGPKLFIMKHGTSSRFENDASMVESGPVLLRCIQILTSVASREVIYPLEACHVALALHCPSVIFSHVYQSGSSRNKLLASSLTRNGSGAKHEKEGCTSVVKIGSDVGVELYVACCRLLCSLIRHRRRESGHCIALLGDSARVLLNCLEVTYWPLADESAKAWSPKMATYCATWLRRIYEELSEHKETLGKYCCHMLSNYLSVLAGHGPVGVGLTREVEAALRPGAYALIDACSANDLQQLHASLGEGARRNALLALRREYTQQFKYTGKV
ncbi:hypothetical protein R1sor_007497 [Riccia sorocarpa]|uniref:Nucleolar 27S pre-rRNA processing Urb2/Npa2 C-terminal domain-containing protein n=1 Tax=Riccia sorocarpa TaxID=122646 RepID=A0ABD3HSS9_9MARC